MLQGETLQYPLLPLRDVVVFPNMVVPLFVGREKSIKALEYAMSHEKEIFLSAQKDAKVDNPSKKDIYSIGTLGAVLQLLRLPDGTVKALIEGKQRARILHGPCVKAFKRISNESGIQGIDANRQRRL